MNIVEEKFVQETKQADIDHHKPTAGAMVGKPWIKNIHHCSMMIEVIEVYWRTPYII
ncbi:hypothetical protein EfmAA242_03510 [Enterococcus faecium]|nr:hypothetical protein EfmAA242_03510 [Enterococcus faecium]